MDIAVSGSSGLIGTALVKALAEAGHRPIRLVRRAPTPGADEIRFEPASGQLDRQSLDGVDGVVNLSGAGIGDRRWTESYKQLCITSRTDSTALLAETMAAMDRPPAVFVSGSAVGYYGSRGDTELAEDAGAGEGFLADLCVAWEAAAKPAVDAGVATSFVRTGIVLSTEGGALSKLLPLFRLGLGGRFGSGRQYMPWITIDDQVAAIIALLDGTITGPVNLTAPNPVTNAEFASVLGRVLGRPALVPIPAFGPRLLMGPERADALLFDSLRVVPGVLEGAGHRFAHRELEDGLRAVLGR